MYLRFVLASQLPACRAETGLFHRAYALARAHQVPDWLRAELRYELDWFDAHLPVPRRLVRRSKRRGSIHGICWFRPEAGEAISRARYVAWLMEEAGEPVRPLQSRDPGEILWRDPMQVVAKPGPHVPRAFR